MLRAFGVSILLLLASVARADHHTKAVEPFGFDVLDVRHEDSGGLGQTVVSVQVRNGLNTIKEMSFHCAVIENENNAWEIRDQHQLDLSAGETWNGTIVGEVTDAGQQNPNFAACSVVGFTTAP